MISTQIYNVNYTYTALTKHNTVVCVFIFCLYILFTSTCVLLLWTQKPGLCPQNLMKFIPESKKAPGMLKRVKLLIFPFPWVTSASSGEPGPAFPLFQLLWRQNPEVAPVHTAPNPHSCAQSAIIHSLSVHFYPFIIHYPSPKADPRGKEQPQQSQPTSRGGNPAGIPAGTTQPGLGSAAGAGRGRICSPGHLGERKTPQGSESWQRGLKIPKIPDSYPQRSQFHIPKDPSLKIPKIPASNSQRSQIHMSNDPSLISPKSPAS